MDRYRTCKLSVWVILAILVTVSVAYSNQTGQAAATTTNENSAFYRFFIAGGPLGWVLLAMSMVTVSLITQNFIAITRKKLLPQSIITRIRRAIETDNAKTALKIAQNDDSMIANITLAGLELPNDDQNAVEIAISETLEQETTGLLRKIEWLNLIGNVAPMIGLFGTVWGMINAFNGIVRAGGQPEPADLAGGISIALVTTWWGLVVAIPALAAYGFLKNRIDSIAAEAAIAAEGLMNDRIARL